MAFDIAEIISSVKTKTDRINLLRELELLENGLYETGDKEFIQVLQSGVNIITSEAIQVQLQWAENGSDPKVRKSLLDDIINGVKNLKIIQIEIPISPTEAMIKKIFKWVTEKYGKGIILDLVVDNNIIGGARVTYDGIYSDYTLNQTWNEVWNEMRKTL